MRRAIAGLVLALGLLSWNAPVHAQGTQATATAEALFAEGRKLAAEGKYAEACPKYEGAQKIAPTPGTLLNLGDCYEKTKRLASAWASYREAITLARNLGRNDLVETGKKRASTVEPRLAKITITVASTATGIEVTRDGLVVPREAWATPVPVDAGEHVIEVKAPGRKAIKITQAAPAEGAIATVTVPELEADATAAPAAPPVAPTAPVAEAPALSPAPAVQPAAPVEADSGPGIGTQRTIALVAGGVGIVGLALGGIFASSAASANSQSKNECRASDANLCSEEGVAKRKDAIAAGNLATVFSIVGIAGIGAGVTLWLTAPSAPAKAVAVVPSIGDRSAGLTLRGRFE